jgi:hypothetical protein
MNIPVIITIPIEIHLSVGLSMPKRIVGSFADAIASLDLVVQNKQDYPEDSGH